MDFDMFNLQKAEIIKKFRQFNRFNLHLLARFARDFYQDNLTFQQANVITEIYQTQPVTAQTISQALSIKKSQLSLLLKHLEQDDLIFRTQHESDQRSQLLQLTPKGEEAYQHQLEQTNRFLQQEIEQFDDIQLSQLNQTMTHYLATYQHEPQKKDVKIIESGVEDLGYIADIHSRVYANLGYSDYFPKYVFEGLANYVENGINGKTWLAMVNGERAGTISIIPSTDDNGESVWQLRWFAVESQFQGFGIGRKLMTTVMDFINERNIPKIILWTVSDLYSARSLYAKFGFHLVETVDNTEWKREPLVEEKWVWQKM